MSKGFFGRLWSGKGKRTPWIKRIFVVLFVLLVPAPLLYLVIFRFVPVPITPQMVGDMIMQEEVHQSWRSYERISPYLKRSVLGSEDQNFCNHHGFDMASIEKALDQSDKNPKKRLRGASTISQQVARTLFLAPVRSWVRKGAEAWLTVLVEFVWPKKRILEAYLNLVDWGNGNYGAEAAAQAYFGVSATELSKTEAARLATILPNPDKWKADHPGRYVRKRSNTVITRAWEVKRDDLDWCVRKD